MRAGILTEPITIQELVTVKDDFGANTTEYRDVISTRAQVVFNTGTRETQNNEIVNTYQRTFNIRLYHKVDERMIILWHGERYRILSIQKELYKQQTSIITEKINE